MIKSMENSSYVYFEHAQKPRHHIRFKMLSIKAAINYLCKFRNLWQ